MSTTPPIGVKDSTAFAALQTAATETVVERAESSAKPRSRFDGLGNGSSTLKESSVERTSSSPSPEAVAALRATESTPLSSKPGILTRMVRYSFEQLSKFFGVVKYAVNFIFWETPKFFLYSTPLWILQKLGIFPPRTHKEEEPRSVAAAETSAESVFGTFADVSAATVDISPKITAEEARKKLQVVKEKEELNFNQACYTIGWSALGKDTEKKDYEIRDHGEYLINTCDESAILAYSYVERCYAEDAARKRVAAEASSSDDDEEKRPLSDLPTAASQTDSLHSGEPSDLAKDEKKKGKVVVVDSQVGGGAAAAFMAPVEVVVVVVVENKESAKQGTANLVSEEVESLEEEDTGDFLLPPVSLYHRPAEDETGALLVDSQVGGGAAATFMAPVEVVEENKESALQGTRDLESEEKKPELKKDETKKIVTIQRT